MKIFTKLSPLSSLTLYALGLLSLAAIPVYGRDNTDYTKPYLTRQFPVSLDYPAGSRGASHRNSQLLNLKAMALALMEYLQDKDEVYPDMRTPATVQKALLPFRQKGKTFFDPVTRRLYLPNPFLSHKPASVVTDPSKMVLLYEARPAPDGTRGVAFADGHAAAVLEHEWPRLKRLDHIP